MSPGFHIIDKDTRKFLKDEDLMEVERLPSETMAYFIRDGYYKVMTANGESFCSGPVWILWDSIGCPYPITPEEFNKFYVRKKTV